MGGGANAFVPSLTFTNPGFRRGYAYSSALTPLSPLTDVTSLLDLDGKTAIRIPDILVWSPECQAS